MYGGIDIWGGGGFSSGRSQHGGDLYGSHWVQYRFAREVVRSRILGSRQRQSREKGTARVWKSETAEKFENTSGSNEGERAGVTYGEKGRRKR